MSGGAANASAAPLAQALGAGIGSEEVGLALAGFLEWIALQAEADGIDHLLFTPDLGPALPAMAKSYQSLKLQPGLPAFSVLAGTQAEFALAGITELNYRASLPLLLSAAEGVKLADWLERIGCEAPAEHVLKIFGLAGGQPMDQATGLRFVQFLQAWKWKILKCCADKRRQLLQHLTSLGLRPGHRVGYVSLGWDGTAQAVFEQAIRDLVTLYIAGYYFCLGGGKAARKKPEGLRLTSLIGPQNQAGELLDKLYENQEELASLFASYTMIGGGLENSTAFFPLKDGLDLPLKPLGMVTPLLVRIAGEKLEGRGRKAAAF